MLRKRPTHTLNSFYEILAKYQREPQLGMETHLTEILCELELREDEQNAAFDALGELVAKYHSYQSTEPELEFDSEFEKLDESSQRLREFLQSSPRYMVKLSPFIREWISTVVSGKEAEQLVAEERLRSIMNLKTMPFRQVLSLCLDRTVDSTLRVDSTSSCKKRKVKATRYRPATKDQFRKLSQAFEHVTSTCTLHEIFECTLRNEDENELFKNESSVLLCHCSKTPNSIGTILDEGLQIKGFGGRLGPAIYLADMVAKSINYSSEKQISSGQFGVILVVETVLGRTFETKQGLNQCPKDFDSVHAIGNTKLLSKVPINFRDGGSSTISVGSIDDSTRTDLLAELSGLRSTNSSLPIHPSHPNNISTNHLPSSTSSQSLINSLLYPAGYVPGIRQLSSAGSQAGAFIQYHSILRGAFCHHEYAIYDPRRVRVRFIIIYQKTPSLVRSVPVKQVGEASDEKDEDSVEEKASEDDGVKHDESEEEEEQPDEQTKKWTETYRLLKATQRCNEYRCLIIQRLNDLRASQGENSQAVKKLEWILEEFNSQSLIKVYL
jgi:hypothetical protein